MAITMTDKDGSVQNFDTYAEFEQAMILMSRIGGNKVPQDLIDEVSAKHDVKDPTPIQMVDGDKFESAFREATRELAEALDEAAKDRTPVSGEENDLLPVGTQVKLLSQSFCGDLQPGDVGTITDTDTGCSMGLVYSVRVRSGRDGYGWVGRDGVEVVEEDSPTEFRDGDLVRVMKSFKDSLGNVAEIGWVTAVDTIGTGRVFGVGGVLIGDNIDKLQLVCRKEDRKDIEL